MLSYLMERLYFRLMSFNNKNLQYISVTSDEIFFITSEYVYYLFNVLIRHIHCSGKCLKYLSCFEKNWYIYACRYLCHVVWKLKCISPLCVFAEWRISGEWDDAIKAHAALNILSGSNSIWHTVDKTEDESLWSK